MTVSGYKKLWIFEKKEDNTYHLKKYKGNEKQVVIPGYIGKTKVTEIDSNCFPYNNDFIEEIDIDENIEIIDGLSGFKNLKKLNFKKKPKEIEYIYGLGDNIGDFGIFGGKIYFKNRLIAVSKNVSSNFVVDDGTIEISKGAFEDCNNITSVVLPESVKYIKDFAFNGCENLVSINLDKVETIDNSAFCGCKSLKRVNLDNLKKIGWSAFSLSGLQEIDIHGIEKIPSDLCSYCTNLTKVKIGKGITTIERGAFMECINLKEVVLPASLKIIEDSVFLWCKKIEKINLAKDVKTFAYTFEKSLYEKIRPTNKNNYYYDIDMLLNETKNMTKYEIEKYINTLLEEHKLDNFDSTKITQMNIIGFDKHTGEITWKCPRCGFCCCNLYDLLKDNGKMIAKFDMNGCGFC